ncbi:ZN574 protein, partial [Nyctibius grandis]|nr:ZN574 protein [Nyctibius grandis]
MTKFLYHRRTHGAKPLRDAARPARDAAHGARPLLETPYGARPLRDAARPTPEATHGAGTPQEPTAAPAQPQAGAEGPSYRCLMCGKAFAKPPQLTRHQRFVHRLERRHEC